MFANGRSSNNWHPILILVLLSALVSTQALPNELQLELENELLLDLRLDGERLGLDILGYQRGDSFLLSLHELATGLGLPIEVDVVQGVASGWYISEDRAFSLNLAEGEVISGGKRWPITDGEVNIFDGALYVETSALERWFPLQLSAVVRELYLNVVPTELLPIQQRINRRSRALVGSSSNKEPQYPLQPYPFQFFGPHVTNLRLGYSTSRQNPSSDASYSGNYAWLSRGDLGWMTSTLSVSGQTEAKISAARIKLERAGVDGPLGLNHIEVGDISTSAFRGVSIQGSSGSGAPNELFDNQSVSIEGSQLPDWDVEIYQNEQFLAIQTIEQDGRYLFEDIPLLFGENRFELQFFGPNGEFETREEFYFLGPNMLESGQISYEASAVQSGLTVFGVNDIEIEDQGSGIYTGSVNVGLLRNLTLGAGVASQEVGGERLASSSFGLGFSTSRLYGSLRYSDAAVGQDSVDTSLRTSLGNTSLNLQYTRFFDDPLLDISPSKWRSSVDIASSVYSIPFKFEFTVSEQVNSSLYDAVLGTTIPLSGSGRISTSLWFTSFEEHLEGEKTSTSLAGGQTSFNTSIRPWSFRLSTSYAIQPELKYTQLSATGNLSVDSNMSLDVGIRQNSATDVTSYTSGINWRFEKVVISTRVGYDSDERWSGVISAATTLVHQPGTFLPRLDRRASVSSGTVEARVFEDVSDSERQPIEGANVNGLQNFRKATSNESGIAYLSQMPAYRRIDIELDDSSLLDYEMRSRVPGVSIISRPGSYNVVDFPLVRTAELEGHISVTVNGEKMPVSRALVSLKSTDGEVVTQTRTAFDGFYLFEGVEPGDYKISLDGVLEKRVMKQPAKIAVASNSGVIRGLDYILRPVESTTATSTMVAQERESEQESGSSSNTLSVPTLTAALPVSKADASAPSPAKPQAAERDTAQQNTPQADNGTWFVQIGAYDSRDKAQATWDRLSGDMQTLQGKTARFMPYQSMTRLLVGPGTTKDAASELCQQFKADSLDCLVRQVQ